MSNLSWLNPTPHAIAVYASQPLLPVATQHSLPSGRYPLLGPDFHRLDRTSLRLAHLLDHLVSTGEKRRRPSRSFTTETLAKTIDQLDQHYKCSGCNPGKCPDTRRMEFASRTGSRDIAHDRYLCIAVWRSEPPQR